MVSALARSSWGRWSESTRIFSKTLWLERPLRLTVWFHSLGLRLEPPAGAKTEEKGYCKRKEKKRLLGLSDLIRTVSYYICTN